MQHFFKPRKQAVVVSLNLAVCRLTELAAGARPQRKGSTKTSIT